MTNMMEECYISLPSGLGTRNSQGLAFSETYFKLERKGGVVIIAAKIKCIESRVLVQK